MVQTHTLSLSLSGIYSTMKKEWSNVICNNINGPRDLLIEVSQKDKHIIYTWDIKYDRNELIYKIETDSQPQKTGLIITKVKGVGGGKYQE